MKKTIFAAVAAITAAVFTPALANDALVVYTPSGKYLKAVNPIFEKETGVKVELIEAGTGEVLQRARAEMNNPQGDVIAALGAGLMEGEPFVVEPEGGFPAFSRTVGNVFIVNTEQLGDLPVPTSWADLANPIYKGKVAYAGADKSGSAYIQLAVLIGSLGEQAAFDLFETVLPNLIITGSSGQVVRGTGAGEYAIGITNEDAAYFQKVSGNPVELVYPAEGVLVGIDSSAVIKGTDKVEQAEAYIAFLSRADVQQVIVDTFYRRAVAEGATPPEGLPTDLPEVDLDLTTLDKQAVIKKYLALLRK